MQQYHYVFLTTVHYQVFLKYVQLYPLEYIYVPDTSAIELIPQVTMP